ncbi:hypothetical protein [Actinomadura sp. 7K507]|nr:hypothetical protein [Actinomadura sp. 7K507]
MEQAYAGTPGADILVRLTLESPGYTAWLSRTENIPGRNLD